MTDFNKVSKSDLEQRFLDACEVIVSKGMSVGADGKTIVSGSNDASANEVANSFSEQDLEIFTRGASPLISDAVQLINLRRIYALPNETRDEVYFNGKYGDKSKLGKLAQMKMIVANMRGNGFKLDIKMLGESSIGAGPVNCHDPYRGVLASHAVNARIVDESRQGGLQHGIVTPPVGMYKPFSR